MGPGWELALRRLEVLGLVEDAHPDALACRCLVTLAVLRSGCPLPWDFRQEFAWYVPGTQHRGRGSPWMSSLSVDVKSFKMSCFFTGPYGSTPSLAMTRATLKEIMVHFLILFAGGWIVDEGLEHLHNQKMMIPNGS